MAQALAASPARKDINVLDPVTARRIQRVLDRFSETGHADIRRLVNIAPEMSRIRVGAHRVIVEPQEDEREAHIIRIHRRVSAG